MYTHTENFVSGFVWQKRMLRNQKYEPFTQILCENTQIRIIYELIQVEHRPFVTADFFFFF